MTCAQSYIVFVNCFMLKESFILVLELIHLSLGIWGKICIFITVLQKMLVFETNFRERMLCYGVAKTIIVRHYIE